MEAVWTALIGGGASFAIALLSAFLGGMPSNRRIQDLERLLALDYERIPKERRIEFDLAISVLVREITHDIGFARSRALGRMAQALMIGGGATASILFFVDPVFGDAPGKIANHAAVAVLILTWIPMLWIVVLMEYTLRRQEREAGTRGPRRNPLGRLRDWYNQRRQRTDTIDVARNGDEAASTVRLDADAAARRLGKVAEHVEAPPAHAPLDPRTRVRGEDCAGDVRDDRAALVEGVVEVDAPDAVAEDEADARADR